MEDIEGRKLIARAILNSDKGSSKLRVLCFELLLTNKLNERKH